MKIIAQQQKNDFFMILEEEWYSEFKDITSPFYLKSFQEFILDRLKVPILKCIGDPIIFNSSSSNVYRKIGTSDVLEESVECCKADSRKGILR